MYGHLAFLRRGLLTTPVISIADDLEPNADGMTRNSRKNGLYILKRGPSGLFSVYPL
jgi:hypothetical protein